MLAHKTTADNEQRCLMFPRGLFCHPNRLHIYTPMYRAPGKFSSRAEGQTLFTLILYLRPTLFTMPFFQFRQGTFACLRPCPHAVTVNAQPVYIPGSVFGEGSQWRIQALPNWEPSVVSAKREPITKV